MVKFNSGWGGAGNGEEWRRRIRLFHSLVQFFVSVRLQMISFFLGKTFTSKYFRLTHPYSFSQTICMIVVLKV